VCEFLLRKKKRVRRLFRFPPFTFLCVCLFSSSSGAQHTHSSVHCCSVCVSVKLNRSISRWQTTLFFSFSSSSFLAEVPARAHWNGSWSYHPENTHTAESRATLVIFLCVYVRQWTRNKKKESKRKKEKNKW
jgi:hypothetical protein